MELKATLHGATPMTKKQKEAQKELIKGFEKKDKKIEQTRTTRNDFETLVFKAREWINDPDNLEFMEGESEK